MMGFIVALFWFALVLLAFGTVMALYTSWRDGCLQRDIASVKTGLGWVFLRIKNFAQQIFNRTVYLHVRSHWMYYALALGFIAVAFST